ncbi:hypothetical protein C8Q78DRAFT_1051413 [Trametes maxima]|nr:hypothetical protein C8Q78DRAFT_1051413 [Trametes maxima]
MVPRAGEAQNASCSHLHKGRCFFEPVWLCLLWALLSFEAVAVCSGKSSISRHLLKRTFCLARSQEIRHMGGMTCIFLLPNFAIQPQLPPGSFALILPPLNSLSAQIFCTMSAPLQTSAEEQKSGQSIVFRLDPPDSVGALERCLGDMGIKPCDLDDIVISQEVIEINEAASSLAASSPAPSSPAPSSPASSLKTPPSSPSAVQYNLDLGTKAQSTDDDEDYILQGYHRADRSDAAGSGKVQPVYRTDTVTTRLIEYRTIAYYVRLDIHQPRETPGVRGPSTFRLLVDTGSNTTWIPASKYCELKEGGSCAPPPVSWAYQHPRHSVVFYHGYSALKASDVDVSYQIEYQDGCKALLVLPEVRTEDGAPVVPRQKLSLGVLLDCYDWNKKRWYSPAPLEYRFALAIAVNKKLDMDITDGILGLGLLGFQKGFEQDAVNTPSFLHAIQRNMPPVGRKVCYIHL